MRSVRRSLILASGYLAALLLALGGYEVYASVRYTRWRSDFDSYGWMKTLTLPSSNPILLWEYRPHGHYAGELGEITVNGYGFRDRDFATTEKPDGVRRVAFVGDSVTLGILVAPESTFVHRFEVEAHVGSSDRLQALNFGVDGYDARQIAELLRSKVLAFQPDCVVYVMCLNDFDFEWSSGEKRLYFERPRSFALRRLEEAYIKLFRIDLDRYAFRKHQAEVFDSVRGMRDVVERSGGEFLVALLPGFYPGRFEDYPLRSVHERVGKVLSEDGIPHVDLLQTFLRSGRRPDEVSFDVWHPNPRGHEIIAQAVWAAVATLSNHSLR